MVGGLQDSLCGHVWVFMEESGRDCVVSTLLSKETLLASEATQPNQGTPGANNELAQSSCRGLASWVTREWDDFLAPGLGDSLHLAALSAQQ